MFALHWKGRAPEILCHYCNGMAKLCCQLQEMALCPLWATNYMHSLEMYIQNQWKSELFLLFCYETHFILDLNAFLTVPNICNCFYFCKLFIFKHRCIFYRYLYSALHFRLLSQCFPVCDTRFVAVWKTGDTAMGTFYHLPEVWGSRLVSDLTSCSYHVVT